MVSNQLQRYRERRAYAIKALGGKCIVCGATEKLEIDHIDKRDKAFQITQRWSVSQEEYDKELAKCQLLCHEHHREKSRLENDFIANGLEPSTHGTLAFYKNRGCRCEFCKKAYSDHSKAYRLQKQIDEILES